MIRTNDGAAIRVALRDLGGAPLARVRAGALALVLGLRRAGAAVATRGAPNWQAQRVSGGYNSGNDRRS